MPQLNSKLTTSSPLDLPGFIGILTPNMTTKQTPSPMSSTAGVNEKVQDPEATSTQDYSPLPEDDTYGPAPEGGTKAWLNAACGFYIFFCCLGFTSCFGVLQEYYSTHQLRNHTPDDIAWIGSLTSFIQFGGGGISGPLFDRYGANVSEKFPTG
jgi:hypothetical protein